MDMLCCKCKKRPAVLFMSRFDGKETINEGYCLKCASELGLPQVKSMMDSLGITQADLDNLDEQLENGMFEMGGADTMPPFLQKMLGMDGNNGGDNAITPAQNEEEPTADGLPRERVIRSKPKDRADRKRRKYLDNFCTNLNEKARNGQMDRIIGRDKEIYRVEQILSRRQKNNPCLIGEPGVGKTAIAEGIAQKIVSGDVPFRLLDKEVYLLDMTALVAGTQFRGQFESRVKGLIDEVKAQGNVILFIDEVHTLVGTGDSEGSMSAANILKPALSRGEIQVIGATTFSEYRKNIEKDAALERRFQPVTVDEPTVGETVEILRGLVGYYEQHHKVHIPDNILVACANLSERYITDRYLPDKAIDLLDESAACASIKSTVLTEVEKLNRHLKELNDQEQELTAAENMDYEAIAKVKGGIITTKEQLKELEPEMDKLQVTMDDVARVIELWTGIPAEKVSEDVAKKMANLERELKARIIGQDQAVDAVVAAIRRSKVRLDAKKRPASFIFVGPTGVGKTELSKVLAQELFEGKVDPLIRVDMSEYMERHTVSRLVGSPPGYVGFDEAGQLTEKVRRHPYSVVLFDEIEKAHPDVMNILLQILDEGRITDAQGRVVNFENTVIIMTSNAGSSDRTAIVGFNKTESEISKEKALGALSRFLRPEFLARVDEIVVFNPLSEESMVKIADLMMKEMEGPLHDLGIQLHYDDAALKLLAKKGGGKFAARDLRSTIRREVEDKIANLVLSDAPSKRDIYVSAKDDEIVVTIS